jgi:nicotinamide-nucleotide amidase
MLQISAELELLAQHLLEKEWSITTAESCTGGGISTAITSLAGSSRYFNQAYVTYSNESKQKLVGVKTSTLEAYGAVSEQVVVEMANGALERANANVSIAVSGVAGPDGGTPDKPVGTVWLAVSIKNNEQAQTTVYTEQLLLDGDRCQVRESTIKFSIIKTLDLISK